MPIVMSLFQFFTTSTVIFLWKAVSQRGHCTLSLSLTLCQTEDVDLRACGRRIIWEVYHHVKYLCWWMEWLKRSPLVCTPTMSWAEIFEKEPTSVNQWVSHIFPLYFVYTIYIQNGNQSHTLHMMVHPQSITVSYTLVCFKQSRS